MSKRNSPAAKARRRQERASCQKSETARQIDSMLTCERSYTCCWCGTEFDGMSPLWYDRVPLDADRTLCPGCNYLTGLKCPDCDDGSCLNCQPGAQAVAAGIGRPGFPG